MGNEDAERAKYSWVCLCVRAYGCICVRTVGKLIGELTKTEELSFIRKSHERRNER